MYTCATVHSVRGHSSGIELAALSSAEMSLLGASHAPAARCYLTSDSGPSCSLSEDCLLQLSCWVGSLRILTVWMSGGLISDRLYCYGVLQWGINKRNCPCPDCQLGPSLSRDTRGGFTKKQKENNTTLCYRKEQLRKFGGAGARVKNASLVVPADGPIAMHYALRLRLDSGTGLHCRSIDFVLEPKKKAAVIPSPLSKVKHVNDVLSASNTSTSVHGNVHAPCQPPSLSTFQKQQRFRPHSAQRRSAAWHKRLWWSGRRRGLRRSGMSTTVSPFRGNSAPRLRGG